MTNEIVIDTLTREYGEASLAHRAHIGLPVPEDALERGRHYLEQDPLCTESVHAKRRLDDAMEKRRGTDEVEDWYVATRQDLSGGTQGQVFAQRDTLMEWLASPDGQYTDRVYLVRNFAMREDLTRKIAGELLCAYLASGKTIDDDRYPHLCREHLTRDEMFALVKA